MTGTSPHPETVLSRARLRMLVGRSSEIFVRFGLAFFTGAVVLAAIHRAWTGRLPEVGWIGWTFFLFGAGWLAWTLFRFPRRIEVARRLDRAACFKDRIVTYLDFGTVESRKPYQELALRQTVSEIAKLNVARCCPLKIPRQAAWLVLPAICFLNLWLLDHFSRPPIIRDPLLEQVLVAKADELKKLADQLKKEAEARKLDEVAKVARDMQKAAEQIKPQDGRSSAEMRKSALLEWSRLEAKLANLSKAGPVAGASELRDLAATLEQDPATQSLAKMLKQGDLAGAMQELKALMEQAQNDPGVAQQLREMAQKIGQMQMSSEQMAEMMKQMRQAASGGQKSQTQEAMQSFSQMLSGMEKNRQQNRLASSGLSALQMMKTGMNKGGQGMAMGSKGDEGDQKGKMPGKGDGESQNKEGRGIGSETMEDIFGEKTRIDAIKNAARAEGQVGEGRSFENILKGSGETVTSTVEYRELFNNYTPEAEEAIYQENIPLGSKYYIKRYFESIRPQQ